MHYCLQTHSLPAQAQLGLCMHLRAGWRLGGLGWSQLRKCDPVPYGGSSSSWLAWPVLVVEAGAQVREQKSTKHLEALVQMLPPRSLAKASQRPICIQGKQKIYSSS